MPWVPEDTLGLDFWTIFDLLRKLLMIDKIHFFIMRRAEPFGWLMVEFCSSKWYFWVSNWQGLDSEWAIFIVNLIRFRSTKYMGEAHLLIESRKAFTEKVSYIGPPILNVDCILYPMDFDLDRLKRKWEHGCTGKPHSASWSQWRKPLWSDRPS